MPNEESFKYLKYNFQSKYTSQKLNWENSNKDGEDWIYNFTKRNSNITIRKSGNT